MRLLPDVSPALRRGLITLAVVALVAARKHDSFTNPQFWAEDGGIFFTEAERYGWSIFFKPYEGYLHFFPRLVAAIGTYLPLIVVPVFYATTALLATGGIAWAIQSPRLRIPTAWAGALAIGLIPHRGEVYLTLANFQWIAALGLFVLPAMDDARTRGERIGDVVLLVVTALTGPFVILALPLFAWRAWRTRSTWSLVLLAVAVACALAHGPSLLHRVPSPITENWHFIQHFAVVGNRTWVRLFTPTMAIAALPLSAITLCLAVTIGFSLERHQKRMQSAWMLFFACVVVLAATGYKARIDTWNPAEPLNGDRYFFVSEVLLLWLLAAFCVTGRAWERPLAAVVLLAPVAFNFSLFVCPPFPDQEWRKYAAQIEEGKPTMVPILPQGFKMWHPGRH